MVTFFGYNRSEKLGWLLTERGHEHVARNGHSENAGEW